MTSAIPGLSGYVTTAEAAKVLGVTANAIVQRIHRHRLDTVRVGHVLLVRPTDLTRTGAGTRASV